MTDDEESNNKECIKQSNEQENLTPKLSTALKLQHKLMILCKGKDDEDNI